MQGTFVLLHMGKDGIFKSTCGMCHGGCGVLVTVSGGKAVKIEGDPDSPLNKGALCPKGMASLEHLYNTKRLRTPLQRIGERGEGRWKKISWGAALGLVAEKLEGTKKDCGPHGVAFMMGTFDHFGSFVSELASEFGSPNVDGHHAICYHPREKAERLTYGNVTFCDFFGGVAPECILVWGANPVNSGLNPGPSFPFLSALKKGSMLVTIDPRRSETAKMSDLWVQIRPGTDCALALAMLNVIISENLYDKKFVDSWTVGFERLKRHVRGCTPEWAEKITWVPSGKIRDLARAYAKSKPACIRYGVSLEQATNSIQTARAVSILIAITGNLDVEGGNIFPDLGMLGLPSFPKRGIVPPVGGFPYLSSGHFPSILKAIRTGEPYQIRDLLVFGSNPLVTQACSVDVYDALMRLDLLVVADIYMTPTAELADIVLPAATWLEIDSVRVPVGNTVFAHRRMVRMYQAIADELIVLGLAKRLRLPMGALTPEKIFDYQLSPRGISFAELKKKGQMMFSTGYRKYLKNGFATPSGRIELFSEELQRNGFGPMPSYREPAESPVNRRELAKEYPLILITGGRSREFFHSEGRQIASLRKRHPLPLVELNPVTAKKYGIRNGDPVLIETSNGGIVQKARLDAGMHPKVVHIEHGWWFPEISGQLHGVWASNANVLTGNKGPFDPEIGSYQLRGLLCRISKANIAQSQ